MTGLPNVAALLAEATPGKWRSRPCNDLPPKGRYRWVALGSNGNDTSPLEAADARLIACAPTSAAALVEAADALSVIGCQNRLGTWVCDLHGKRRLCLRCAALARLVAFDASLKETTE